MSNFNFHNKLILRTSLLPYTDIPNGLLTNAYLNDELFLEALYVSTPDLFDLHKKKPNDENIKLAIVKYFLRASTRTTPFGLYAGPNTVDWANKGNKGVLINEFNRITKLDISCLDAICKSILESSSIKNTLKLYPNTSIYKLSNYFRYIEPYGLSQFQLSSFSYSAASNKIISFCQGGRTFAQLVDFLTTFYPGEEKSITFFLEEMITNKILIHDLTPQIIGTDPLEHIILTLNDARNNKENSELVMFIRALKDIISQLLQIDKQKVRNRSNYVKLKEHIENVFNIKVPLNKLINVTMFPIYTGGLDRSFQRTIIEALEILSIINQRPQKNHKLQQFILQFSERYQGQQKSLLEVLDHENGIGYSDVSISGEMMTEMMKNITPISDNNSHHSWDTLNSYLLGKVVECQRNGNVEITLDKTELLKVINCKIDKFSQKDLSVLFRVADDKIFFENAVSYGKINTITRFAVINENIKELASELSSTVSDEDAPIYAEINHYPDPTSANILRRPRLTKHQISIIYNSSVSAQYQIPINDLLISLKGKEFVLYSKRLKRQVIPVLLSAHNFHHSKNLSIYTFLCDLQLQSENSILTFNWSVILKDLIFLPRVKYKSGILSLARWTFKDENLAFLIKDIKEFPCTPFMKKWSVPTKFVVSEGDNELYIDLQEDSNRKIILKILSKCNSILIKEVFFAGNTVVSENGGHTNQFLSFLKGHGEKKYNKVKSVPNLFKNTLFYPLSEWVYFKIYCGRTISDEILNGAIKKLTNKLLADNLIDKWFYIRYEDPEYHLRVRLSVKKSELAQVINRINNALELLIRNKKAWKIQFDTYSPEIERYSACKMEISEFSFYLSSKYTIRLLTYLKSRTNQEQEKYILSMALVDNLLSAMNFNTDKKLTLVCQFKKTLEIGYNINTDFWKKIDLQFREDKIKILKLMDFPMNSESKMVRLLTDYKAELEKLYKTSKTKKEGLKSYIFSLTHMQINRLFREHQKINELITYQMLVKYYSLVLYSKTRL